MRLDDVDLSGADLSEADLTGVVVTEGSLSGAVVTRSRWDHAAILGTKGVSDTSLARTRELAAASIAGLDRADVVVDLAGGTALGVALSPDGALLAYGSGRSVKIARLADGKMLRILHGHTDNVNAVAFSPDGTLLATASSDGTARTWDTATGAPVATLVALSGGGYATLLPDGSYKLHGEPGDDIWWAIKLCRFQPGELDPYVPELRRLEAGERILPPGQ